MAFPMAPPLVVFSHLRWDFVYYPIPRPENGALYKRYEALAKAEPGVHFVGRLATYRYCNMDQVVAQALTLFDKIEAGLTKGSAVAASGSDGEARSARAVKATLPTVAARNGHR